MEKIYLSWDEIEDAIESLAHQIKQSGKKIGSMDGLARGGLIPAVMLSHKLGIPFMNENNNDEGYILIVDDIVGSGQTLISAVKKIRNHYKIGNPIRTLALLTSTQGIENLSDFAKIETDYRHHTEPPRVCRRLQLPNRMEP
jgi:hypoxanthine phosphoribosyltransferase